MAASKFALSTSVTAETEEEIGEFVVAEYIVFLLAMDTYIRYVEETTGEEDPTDEVISRGLRLLKMAESQAEAMMDFLMEHLPSETHKKMARRAFFRRLSQVSGVGERSLKLRTLLRNTTTMRAVFEKNKTIKMVREAVSSSMLDDADAALDRFVAIPMKNQRFKAWIKKAADTAGSGEPPKTVTESASDAVEEETPQTLLKAQVEELATPGAEGFQKAQAVRKEQLQKVEEEASKAAKEAIKAKGEEDAPPKKSEVIGTVAAAVESALSDPSRPQNVPEPLRRLDDEQRAAALTDGRVLVAAGAGSGKSTTLIARVNYLIRDRRVDPSRILVTSFNTKAAAELTEKIGKSAGGEALQQMSVGTMHSLFKRFIKEYGTREEMIAVGAGGKGAPSGLVRKGTSVAAAVQRVWEDCFNKSERPAPKLKNMMLKKTQWAGNNVTPAMARAQATSKEDVEAALWYEMYEGLKGAIPGWSPPCKSYAYESFMGRTRKGISRLGDFDDMLKIFHDLLKREPGVKAQIHRAFDHILIDECQDLNQVQHGVFEMMSEHITDGRDGKSLWMVGDEKQSIYGFRGARPDLFTDLYDKEGWTTRTIRTNYRCQPEIVEAANRLIAHNPGQVQMSLPSPVKAKGAASIEVLAPEDEVTSALTVVEGIKSDVDTGSPVSDHAVLFRTNKEIHAYETACIIRGVPYARKGASSFLGSPETTAFLSYVQLATGTDFVKMQKSLGSVLNNPNRFFIDPKRAATAVQLAIEAYSRFNRQDIKSINPVAALQDRDFVEILVSKILGYRRGESRDPKTVFKFDKAMEMVYDLSGALAEMQSNTSDPDYTTQALFDDILNVRGIALSKNETGRLVRNKQTFRESLQVGIRDFSSDDEEAKDEDESEEDEGLGNVSFLFKLVQTDPTDPEDMENPPSSPLGFKAKMERYAARVRDLRIDTDKWEKEQADLPPEQRKPPPGVYLGTTHSVKGAQWKNCYVQMPNGKFPLIPPPKPGEPPPDPEELEKEMESERRLAYVALTRAIHNLTILCPKVVGGRAAGVSPFVDEAGLITGQNVPKAVSPSTEKTAKWAEDLVF